MKNRNVILLAIAAALLAALYAMSLLAGREGYANLLLVTPSVFGAPEISPERLEEFSEEEFLLTYEIKQPASAQAINTRHPVTLTGTNQNYANIMGYVPLDGGFFTKAAWDARNRHAVLNETAAFQLFGSNRITGKTLKMNGDVWIVTGVIQDNDAENANIYAPSSVTGGRVKSLMALMDRETVTETYVKNALKSIGMHENNYDYINLSKSASAFDERVSVAWKAALFIAVLLFVLKMGGKLMKNLGFYQNRLREIYFQELFAYHRADLVKTAAGLLFFMAGVASVLLLSLAILKTCLTWQEIVPITGELVAGDFGEKLAWLRDYQWVDIALFTACIAAIVTCFPLFMWRRPHESKKRH